VLVAETEPRIIAGIIAAHRRGMLITVILDKISPGQKGEGADPVHDAGIATFIDRKPKIAHNKVVVIDQTTVITGSFNFSTNAGCCNADCSGLVGYLDWNADTGVIVESPARGRRRWDRSRRTSSGKISGSRGSCAPIPS
jgi:phosphatidylserine/phosphatidylglycerophosphate/cardiolipin synthase-like enzyme